MGLTPGFMPGFRFAQAQVCAWHLVRVLVLVQFGVGFVAFRFDFDFDCGFVFVGFGIPGSRVSTGILREFSESRPTYLKTTYCWSLQKPRPAAMRPAFHAA